MARPVRIKLRCLRPNERRLLREKLKGKKQSVRIYERYRVIWDCPLPTGLSPSFRITAGKNGCCRFFRTNGFVACCGGKESVFNAPRLGKSHPTPILSQTKPTSETLRASTTPECGGLYRRIWSHGTAADGRESVVQKLAAPALAGNLRAPVRNRTISGLLRRS